VTLPSARTDTEWEMTLPSAIKWSGLYMWLSLLQELIRSERWLSLLRLSGLDSRLYMWLSLLQELIRSERWLSLLRLSGLDCTCDSPFCKNWYRVRRDSPFCEKVDWTVHVTLPSARTYTEWEVTRSSAIKWSGLYMWLSLLQELIQSETWLSLLRVSGLDCTCDSPFC